MNELNHNTATDGDSDVPGLDAIERRYFAPTAESFAAAEQYIQTASAACTAAGVPFALLFEPDDIPSGFGLAIVPVQQRAVGGGNTTVAVAAAAVPDPATVLASGPQGESWARDALSSVLVSRLANAIRPRSGESWVTPLAYPQSIGDFIAPSRDTGLAWFREHAKRYVDGLNNHFKKRVVSVQTLRQILASRAYAETSALGKVQQSSWEKLLRTMIADAEREGADPGIVRTWLETRNSTVIEAPSIDDDDIAALFGSAETESA